MTTVRDRNGDLTRCHEEPHLPTVRECYEETAESAGRESVS